MRRTGHTDRPFVRARRDSVVSSKESGGIGTGPGRLAALAGSAARPAVERLEPRQMLFSLTITADSVGPDGIGSAAAIFGFALPVLLNTAELNDDTDANTTTEGFGDLGNNVVPPVNVATGFQFPDSGLRTTHTVLPAGDFQIDGDRDPVGQVVEGTERLEVRLDNLPQGAGEQFTLDFDADQDPANGFQPRAVTAIQFDAGLPDGRLGLPVNNVNIVVTQANGTEVFFPAGNAVQGLNQFPFDQGVGNDFQNGRGTFVLDSRTTPGLDSAILSVRFESAIPGSPQVFSIDNVTTTIVPALRAPLVDNTIFGAEVRFRGPVGASVEFLDLFGDNMVQTLSMGIPDFAEFALSDPDDDGVPNFNVGIGEVILSNTDARTQLTISGGTVEPSPMPPMGASVTPDRLPNDTFWQSGFLFTRANTFEGLVQEFESAGFGFASVVGPQGEVTVGGVGPTQGAVVIGAPFERPETNFNPEGLPPGSGPLLLSTAEFNNPDQGVRVLDGSAMGRVTINGFLFGSSNFTGTLESLNVGTLLGSVSVAGDLGSLVVVTEAGLWGIDPDFDDQGQLGNILEFNKTGAELFVGRSVREIAIGGRSLLDVTVLGDLDSPATRPPRDVLRFEEQEHINPIDENTQFGVDDFFRSILEGGVLDDNQQFTPAIENLPTFFGTDVFRNDTILSAEWIGSVGSAVELSGTVGVGDPAANPAEDPADVFAFATDGIRPVEFLSSSQADIRIVDQAGRTLGGVEQFSNAEDSQRLVFNPPSAGVFYLVVSDPGQTVDGDFDGSVTDYTIAISGLAPTTLGSYRVGGGSGNISDNVTTVSNNVTVLNGSIGAIRAGTGFVDGRGQEVEVFSELTNTFAANADENMRFGGGTFSTPGDVFAIVAGGDIQPGQGGEPLTFNIGGNLGMLFTGQSPILGTGFTQGDIEGTSLNVGGNIGTIDINGAVAIDQDTPTAAVAGDAPFRIVTGTNGDDRGDIGLFRVGSTVFGDGLLIEVPDDATIGALLFNQDIGDQPDASGNPGIRGGTPEGIVTTGFGADVRFIDFAQVDIIGDNTVQPLIVGQTLEITDDSGASVRITINGIGQGTQAGLVRVLPINNSQGVAIAQIEANLSGNRDLDIVSVGADGETDPISIGRIELTDSTPLSDITITGPIPVDIWRIEDDGGMGLNAITNNTPGGDIVAADIGTLNSLTISDGHLGLTEVPAFGPRLIGPDLTIQSGLNGNVGGPIGVDPNAIEPVWNGQAFRPTNDATVAAFLDDLGGPVDPFLNGLIVRGGNVQNVQVSGSIGDVILQGAGAVLANVEANTDQATELGGFDGIVGSIYAPFITRVEVGDGLARAEQGPIANVGIFATDEIGTVEAGAVPDASIEGFIFASDINVQVNQPAAIGTVQVDNGGSIRNAEIGVAFHDFFWIPSVPVGENRPILGDIGTITVQDGDVFGSIVDAININTVTITNGFYDATDLTALGNLGTISATGFRNSTLGGTDREFRPNRVRVAEDLTRLTTENQAGDVLDLLIDVNGDVLQSLDARNFTRVEIQIDNEIPVLRAGQSIRGSTIVAGDLPVVDAGNGIVSSRFRIAGAVESFTADVVIRNIDLGVTGPNGRIDLLEAPSVDGVIRVSGPVSTIRSTVEDVRLDLTTTGDRGVVGTLSAARDLVLTTDVSAGLNTLAAGRHIGDIDNPGVVLVDGNVTRVSAPNGQLYSDIRAGGTIGIDPVLLPDGSAGAGTGGGVGGGTGGSGIGVTIGRANSLPGSSNLGSGSIVAFDRIGPVVVNGDFAGSVVSYSGGLADVAINNGSLLPGARIAAFDGDVESLVITQGHLLGDVHADFDIVDLQVVGGGVFGNIGIDPSLSSTTAVDGFRAQLPQGAIPTAGIDGPRITAGHDILSLTADGSVFEALFHAGRRLVSVDIGGGAGADTLTEGVRSTFFTAGDRISTITLGGNVSDTLFAAGLFDLGSDEVPGGVGAAADTVRSGIIDTVTIAGAASRLGLAAGAEAGPDGVYATGDDRVVIGSSVIRDVSVAGAADQVVAVADAVRQPTREIQGINVSAAVVPFADPALTNSIPGNAQAIPGAGLTVTIGGVEATLRFTGTGAAFYDAPNTRIILSGTRPGSSLTVSGQGTLSGLDIVSGDQDSLGLLDLQVPLAGDSTIAIDRDVNQFNIVDLQGGSVNVRVGETIGTLNAQALTGGHIQARSLGAVAIAGDFGNANPAVTGEASLSAISSGAIDIGGATRGLINVSRTLASLDSLGPIERSLIRAGDSLGSSEGSAGAITAPSISQTRVSVANDLGLVEVAGDVFDTAFMIGGDLGEDAEFGGVGINADRVGSGNAAGFDIGGDFAESDIVAGYLRGPDGFFGTPDDMVASGRSTVGDVTIAGTDVGSTRGSESFLIGSTGTLGEIEIGGTQGVPSGNFDIRVADTLPTPIRVESLEVTQASGIFTATLFFNQDMDASTLSSALTVREVRGVSGAIEIFLIEGRDYTITYDAQDRAALIRFDRSVTERDLPQVPSLPGPGIFRFVLDGDLLRAQVSNARLDGDGDGFAQPGERFSADDFVGDVGDKLVNNTALLFGSDGQQVFEADFRAPGSLDIVLDNNNSPDGLADANTQFTLRGTIGDHPDHDPRFFGFASDVDVFTVTLQAGQILRLGQLSGSALLTPVAVFGPSGAGTFTASATPDLLSLPVNPLLQTDLTSERALLARTTGLYTIAVGPSDGFGAGFGTTDISATSIANPNQILDIDSQPSTVGDYSFTIEIFDDGNSGFSDVVDSGNGLNVPDAPAIGRFAGPDGQFGTNDDPAQVTVGSSIFTLDPGPDGTPGTNDDVISGGNGDNITSTRSGGAVTTTVLSAIGPERSVGVPGTVFADVDVFNLNNDRPIQPGTLMRLTIRLSEFGGDLGSRTGAFDPDSQIITIDDFTGQVQFGLFDTTDAQGLSDADLVFSPTDFAPNGGQPGAIASNDNSRFGFNDDGDFFIEFVTPGRIGSDGTLPATYAVMLQGAFNSEFALDVTTFDGPVQFQRAPQNVLIETRGGTIDWLQVAGQLTELDGFDPGVLGLVGSATNGQPIGEFILDGLIDNLEQIFDQAGFAVNFSANPADFEFQDFSTVFLTSSVDPISDIFSQVGFGRFGFAGVTGASSQPFGFAQRSDPLNTDANDEAVVFVPTFSNLGRTPAESDVDALVESLSAAVGRHVGELLGLRLTADATGTGLFDLLAADSVTNVPGQSQSLTIPTFDRTLSTPFDSVDGTDFWIGQQDSNALLARILSPA